MIKEAVVKESSTPSVEDGRPCKMVVHGEAVMTKEAAETVKLPEIKLED